MENEDFRRLYRRCLEAAFQEWWLTGSRPGACASGLSDMWTEPVGLLRQVLHQLEKDGWMTTYMAHGEKHYKLSSAVHAGELQDWPL